MERIASFCVDHTRLERGMYLSRQDGDVLTWDIRMKKPNQGDYLTTAAAHTLEHLFATSEISARVGRGFTIMLSSIWVAVTMGLPKEKERSMMVFWMPGSSVKSISTPRSPRATMTA